MVANAFQVSADRGRNAGAKPGRAAPARLFPYAPRNLPATLDGDTYWRLIQQSAPALSQLIEGISSHTFSGSASSDYAGDGVRMVLQRELDINTQAIPGGTLLRHAALLSPSADPD
jgi:hypothetical protein